MQTDLLENIYRKILKEGSTPDVTGLAALVEKTPTRCDATVYRVSDAKKAFARAIEEDGDLYGVSAHDFETLASVSIVKPDHPYLGAWEVVSSYGPGMGKITYGLAFAMSPSGNIIPDRQTVSRSARTGYQRTLASGRQSHPIDDVDHKPSPFHDQTHTDDPSDDGKLQGHGQGDPILDRIYFSIGWEDPMLDSLKRAHEEFVSWATSSLPTKPSREEIEEAIIDSESLPT